MPNRLAEIKAYGDFRMSDRDWLINKVEQQRASIDRLRELLCRYGVQVAHLDHRDLDLFLKMPTTVPLRCDVREVAP